MYIDPDFHTILCFSFCFLRGNKSTVVSKVCVWVVPFRVINSLFFSLTKTTMPVVAFALSVPIVPS